MRKLLWLLVAGSLFIPLVPPALANDELLLAVNTNFQPARPAQPAEESAPAPQPTAPPVVVETPAPAPSTPAAAEPQPGTATTTAPAAEEADTGAARAEADAQRQAIEAAAQEQIIRLQESQLLARKLISEADALYRDDNYQAAADKYAEAIQALPRVQATAGDLADAEIGLNRCYYRIAEEALAGDNYNKAIEAANKALEYDPQSRSARRMLEKAERAQRIAQQIESRPPPPTNPARAPEFLEVRDQIKELFREGKILLNSGQFNAAEEKFQQVLLIDPYNDDAYNLIDQVNRQRLTSSEKGKSDSRRQRLWEVSRAWLPHLSSDVERPEARESSLIGRDPARQAELSRKLSEIIFPEINFRDAVVTDVVNFLSDESRRLDPKGTGVNIVLQLGDQGGGAPSTPAAPPAPAFGEIPGDFAIDEGPLLQPAGPSGGPSARTITVTLREIPMIDALRLITQAAALKFRIEPHAVVVLDKNAPEGELVTRTYPVAPGVIANEIQGGGGEEDITGEETFRAMAGGDVTATPEDVKNFFRDAGVPFPEGSSLVYNQRASKIIIRNTPENLEIFEDILRDVNETPLQVEIEAKFIDISQSDLDELGFEWKVGHRLFGDFDAEGGGPREGFPPGSGTNPTATDVITGGLRDSTIIQGNAVDALLGGSGSLGALNEVASLRGVLTNPQFEVVVRALSQKKSADLLSAPKITTISGNPAQIKVVQEFIYPTEFSEPQVGDNVIAPSIPSEFKTREVGVLLNVTPTVGPDRYTINLTIIPEVSEFLGFIDYSPPPTVNIQRNNDGEITGEQSSENRIQQPLFSSRNLTTTVVIWDSQTVVLGGLIREQIDKIDDKVPFLGDIPFIGRLFQSKAEIASKRNLLIFVTARLVDPAGNIINRPEALAAVAGGQD